jgi:class 3 adenylate cyclase
MGTRARNSTTGARVPMASSSPLPIGQEQRLIAAIVFTDVVGFSARMQSKESETLKLLEKDFAAMRELGASLSGSVLKTTGDGLLLFFKSAVNAVEWALQIQRQFSGHARKLPPGEFLQHRVGVHVGEVFLTGDDVMGDGVNIAARVQTEAPAGGICISQAVYDLVKNKTKLDVIRLEPRKLKNISESIQMYHVLVEPRAVVAPAPVPIHTRPRSGPAAAPPPRSKFGLVAGLLVVGGVVAWLVHSYLENERNLGQSHQQQAALDALLTQKAAESTVKKEVVAPAPVAAPINELEFAQRTVTQTAAGNSKADEERALVEARAASDQAVAWAMTELKGYTDARPLRVQALAQASTQSVFIDRDGRLNIGGSGATRPIDWARLRPDQQGAIILALVLYASAPPPEIVRGAGAFAYVHNLPDMARTLIRERGR